MFSFWQKKKLQDKGLMSKKSRRSVSHFAWLERFSDGWIPKIFILLGFAAGLGFLVFSGEQTEPLKKFLICLLILATAVAQLWISMQSTLQCTRRLLLVFSVILAQLSGIKLLLGWADAGFVDVQLVPLLVPYVFAPLMLSVLLGRNHGLFAATFGSLWGAFLMGAVDPVFLIISLITGFTAVYLTLQVRRRGRLIRAGVFVGGATLLLAATFGQIGPVIWEAPGETQWAMIGWQCLAALGVGIGTAVLVSGLLPAIESLFGLTTDISWLEMADLNHPLLKRMSMEAPGTYHHSLAVANLAEAAAETVGANPTICRVCSYFHDIGKLVKPGYFTENIPHGENPHDELTPTMSALIIIAHVKEGVDLALKHRLSSRIIDAIREHHGNSLVGYFYHRALQQQKDAELGGKIMNMRSADAPQVHESNFRYPGPRPRSKETAIISLADSVESASRSLDRPTPQKIEDLVNGLIQDRLKDHQLDESPLTLEEIRRIGESFRFTLQNMLHSRIAYPKKERDERRGSENSGASRKAAPAA
jgi:putative nucleotidyltransferase with HDIG domain